jgi:16S rRNA processing protein RimM
VVTQTEPFAWLARIRRTQGRKGEVFAEILTDFPERFKERRELWLVADPDSRRNATPESRPDPRPITLKTHWLHKGGIVLHFEGVDSISDAEKLAGLVVAIPRTKRAELDEDAVYVGDLIGCAVVEGPGESEEGTGAARLVGTIEDVDRSTEVPMLIVRGTAGGEILIPFAKSYIRSIDLPAKRITMSLPEGLVELNG